PQHLYRGSFVYSSFILHGPVIVSRETPQRRVIPDFQIFRETLLLKIRKSGMTHKLQPFFSEERSEIGDAAGVAPFIIIPGYNLDHIATEYLSGQTIDDRRVG